MIDIQQEIIEFLEKERTVVNELDTAEIEKAFIFLLGAIRKGKNIYCFGNGGSASTASHFANDFNKIINSKLEKKFNFVCLNDNIPTLMAVANDIGYEEIFRFQLQGHVNSGDVIIAISGSGNSENVINGVLYALENGATVIGLTGFDGGKLKMLSHINLWVPINNMLITEDIHLMFNHLLVTLLSKFTD